MIERRVLKEKEKRRVKKKKEGGGEEGVCGGAGERIQLSLKKKSHFLQSQIIVFIKVEKKKVSLLHSQSGLALVLSLLLLMVINYYYPATQSTADVMSPMSLGQREKKERAGCPSRGGLLAAGGAKREGFCHRLRCDRVLAGAVAGVRCQPGPPPQQLASVLVRLDACCPAAGCSPRFGSRGYLGRKHKIKTGSPCCLLLSPNFG